MLEQRDETSFGLSLTRRRRFRLVSLRCIRGRPGKVDAPACFLRRADVLTSPPSESPSQKVLVLTEGLFSQRCLDLTV